MKFPGKPIGLRYRRPEQRREISHAAQQDQKNTLLGFAPAKDRGISLRQFRRALANDVVMFLREAIQQERLAPFQGFGLDSTRTLSPPQPMVRRRGARQSAA